MLAGLEKRWASHKPATAGNQLPSLGLLLQHNLTRKKTFDKPDKQGQTRKV
jgi:hypothetical protein